ncbi:20S-pre-rRNA D-site endonuclease nob1 [Glonium stellatum]|uniref:20S-pre-rRNA D-site endonuclease NOB1 n=1 Tax=Glonium stellatum TaxID=574774 RepID=A0A8E2FBJ3_9PEZI|nr:20S-pre-rRNA D-site endonuclease nob1 [Glonium stellatum]
MSDGKPVHTIVLDAGPIIKNEPSISSLLAEAEYLVTTPAVISEIRDATTRSRVETMLLPFLTLRNPKPASCEIVANFAKKTGDLAVLSRPDLEILALAYELECERNGGNWRLRSVPGQKGTNGPPPSKQDDTILQREEQGPDACTQETSISAQSSFETADSGLSLDSVGQDLADLQLTVTSDSATGPTCSAPDSQNGVSDAQEGPVSEESSSEDSDSGGWITPSNIKKHQEKDSRSFVKQASEAQSMQVATVSTDFALQNVLLQMNLNLLSTNLHRVKHLNTYILRCYACFFTTKQMEKQFCPRCGKPTLTRVACSTNQNGEFKLHLKKNFQWNNRGNRYSVPKPVSGSANGRIKGGGKDGWGQDLILAEDQKEYVRAIGDQKRQKQRDLMDEDYLPGILTGERGQSGGKPKVGAGRNVNSRKR